MINYWVQEDNQFVKISKDELSQIESNRRVWIDARRVSQDDVAQLQAEYNLDPELLLDVLDQDELSRIEQWDDYALAILRLPVFTPNSEVAYSTAPVGAVIFPEKIITICWTDCEVLKDLSNNRIKGLSLNDFPAFLIRILARSDIMFLRYLKEISRRVTSIQNELHEQIENAELIQLLNLEKSLTYFTTSLKSNQLLLEKIRRTRILKLDSDDQEWLDDVEIDNRQAMEMADTYSSITTGVMDAFANVISNNMNVAMKKLAVINLVMMAPTFVTSFFGMNFKLPFDTLNGYIPVSIATIICVLSVMLSWWLLSFNKTARTLKKVKKAKKRKKS
ncbi:MAG: magnesium transporter CorA family protein [Treponema sp.]|uniref:magnesium transporter CorA family protein n=1 Tax=Treponema sp. TaxID=166 RepID=UPI0025D309BC|nr:magnesium transporter CorA family protein [Treponema sp.]MBR0497064.1 magnesium transporter CorA family protein [Treponema sp.]